MSCGLGAIILVFILVKPDVAATSTLENRKLQTELETIRQQEDELVNNIEETRALSAKELKTNQLVNAEVTRLRKALSENKQNRVQKKSTISEVKKSITKQSLAC